METVEMKACREIQIIGLWVCLLCLGIACERPQEKKSPPAPTSPVTQNLTPALETSPETLTVFAAASLGGILDEIAREFENRENVKVKFNFAATSTLAKQIESGARADLFISADKKWMLYLVERKFTEESSVFPLLENQLVLITPAASSLTFQWNGGKPLGETFTGRLAMGDPEHVPVGEYARQSLIAAGWWESLRPRLSPAADTRAALRSVEMGEAEVGIVYATDAKVSKDVRVVTVIPASIHEPIQYYLCPILNTSVASGRFETFLKGPEAEKIFLKSGFSLPCSGNTSSTTEVRP
jgi:molybdate transport system substrate-binding protein